MLVAFAAAIGVTVFRGRGDLVAGRRRGRRGAAAGTAGCPAGPSWAPASRPAWWERARWTLTPRFLLAIGAMAAASYACRIAGYLLMGYVPVTPRVQAALKAIPLGVMIGIVMPSAAAARCPNWWGWRSWAW